MIYGKDGHFDSMRDPDIREITFRNALFSLSKVRDNIGLLKARSHYF